MPVKTPDQQAVLCIHRFRQGLVRERTGMINQLRGLFSELGICPKAGTRLSKPLLECWKMPKTAYP